MSPQVWLQGQPGDSWPYFQPFSSILSLVHNFNHRFDYKDNRETEESESELKRVVNDQQKQISNLRAQVCWMENSDHAPCLHIAQPGEGTSFKWTISRSRSGLLNETWTRLFAQPSERGRRDHALCLHNRVVKGWMRLGQTFFAQPGEREHAQFVHNWVEGLL